MPEALVLTHATLIDCTGADPRPDMAVVVGEGIIRKVAPSRSLRRPRGAQVVDLADRTLMPGLIDAHVHLGITETSWEQVQREPAAVYALKVSRVIEQTLDAGFTTVRDAGLVDGGFAQAVEHGYLRGPRILPSGAPISQTGGHGDWRARYQDHWPEAVPGLVAPPALCDGVEEVRRAARQQLRRGATQVKVMASGGAMSPSDDIETTQLTVEELAAAAYEAKAAGRYAMAHTYSPGSIRNAVEAGVRSIEHGNFLDEETAALMKAQGAYLVPTLATYELIDRFGEQYGVSAFSMQKIRLAKARGAESVRIAVAAGVKIGSGSDLLGPMQPFKTLEFSLKAEILGPMAALVSATRTNAELLCLADRTGTVEEGKWADLIVVEGNPVENIDVLREAGNVRLVVKRGEVLKNTMP
jgi:imidazolonepropionase-like amidohydrolase